MNAKEVYRDNLGVIIYYPIQRAILHTYLQGSEGVEDSLLLEHMKKLAEKLREYKPVGLIEDYARITFIPHPDLYAEIVKIIKPVTEEIGLKKYAKLIKKGDFVSELMAEQIVEEARKLSSYVVVDKLFIDLDDALEWIGKNKS